MTLYIYNSTGGTLRPAVGYDLGWALFVLNSQHQSTGDTSYAIDAI